jgi:hypothetical protein
MKEFFNAKLGIPYIDVENQPITEDVLDSCVNTDMKWAYHAEAPKDRKQHTAMGVDQHGGNCYCVIAKRGPGGKRELVHFEIIDSANPRYWENGKPVSPFNRIIELFKEFNCQLCVIDAMPNYNEAMQFAYLFPGRVFLAFYGDAGQDMVKWLDKVKPKEQIRKGSKEIKIKWQVIINRYMSIDFMLKQWVDRAVQLPHPDALTQTIKNKESGYYEVENIVRTYMYKHLRSLVREKEMLDEETGRYRMKWIYTEGDPHSVHALNYCNVALGRLARQAIWSL